MPAYAYKAFDAAGKVVEGHLQGSDERDILGQLKTLELSPLKVLERRDKGGKEQLRRRRIGRRDMVHFTGQLASLLNANLPLARALEAVEAQATGVEMKALVADIASRVREGEALSEALAAHPKYFAVFYRSMVRAGEVGGVLPDSLGRVSEVLEKNEELRSKLRGALTYPAIMFCVMIGAVTVLLTFVVPRFTGMFDSMGGTLPLPTRIILVGISGVFAS